MSATANKLRGDWNSIKGKLKLEYGEFTDEDLEFQNSQEDELPERTRKVTRMHQRRACNFQTGLRNDLPIFHPFGI